MRNWNNGDNWDFARWLRNTSRNAKANLAVNKLPAEEIALYRTVVSYFCNIEEEQEMGSSSSGEAVGTGTYAVGGTRPWLYQRLLDKATSASTDYRFDATVEPDYVIVRALEVIARDLIAIPLSAEETAYLETLDFMPVNGTDHAEGDAMHRAFGSQPGFGGVIGSREGATEFPEDSSSSGEVVEDSSASDEVVEDSSASDEVIEDSSASE